MYKYILPVFVIVCFSVACESLKTDMELEIERQPVVECYLEVGQPIRLTLSQSEGFFVPFDTTKAYWEQLGLLPNAEVIISGGGLNETLRNQLTIDPLTNRVFNYVSDVLVPNLENAQYQLHVRLPNGTEIEGTTFMLPVIPIDSMAYSYSEDDDELARALTYFKDPLQSKNFYQYVLRYDRKYDTLPRQNFPFPDDYFQSENITLVGTYDLRKRQEAIATLAHINEDYHDFLRSTNLAILGSQNPVVLPSQIKSNVRGSANPIGIFTALAIDRDTIMVK